MKEFNFQANGSIPVVKTNPEKLKALGDYVGRINTEAQIHSNLPSVVSKLKNEGTISYLTGEIKTIFENEVAYTLRVLHYLRESKKSKVEADEFFDMKEQLINNVYIFKENFKTTLKILIDDLWNNYLSLGTVVETFIQDFEKQMEKSNKKSFSTTGECFEIKEEVEEENLETPKIDRERKDKTLDELREYSKGRKTDRDENSESHFGDKVIEIIEPLSRRITSYSSMSVKVSKNNSKVKKRPPLKKKDPKSLLFNGRKSMGSHENIENKKQKMIKKKRLSDRSYHQYSRKRKSSKNRKPSKSRSFETKKTHVKAASENREVNHQERNRMFKPALRQKLGILKGNYDKKKEKVKSKSKSKTGRTKKFDVIKKESSFDYSSPSKFYTNRFKNKGIIQRGSSDKTTRFNKNFLEVKLATRSNYQSKNLVKEASLRQSRNNTLQSEDVTPEAGGGGLHRVNSAMVFKSPYY